MNGSEQALIEFRGVDVAFGDHLVLGTLSLAGLACGSPWICSDRAAAPGGRARSWTRSLAVHCEDRVASATPDILAGVRLGLTVSLILAVVCEMIAGLDGLGQWVLLAARAYKSADIFAGVALLGAIGVVANGALSAIELRILRWRSTDLA